MNTAFVANGRTVAGARGWNWIADAWGFFRRQPGIWIGITVIAAVIFIVLAFIPLLGMLATFVLTPVFVGGIVIGCRTMEQGGSLELGHLFAGFRTRSGVLVTLGLLYLAASFLIMLVAFAVSGAGMFAMFRGGSDVMASLTSLLLAVLIMLALWIPVLMAMWFAPPLALFHELGAVDALKASFTGCLKNIVPFLFYSVILFLLGIVASIPFGLGWLVLGPVTAASVYTAYRDIFFS